MTSKFLTVLAALALASSCQPADHGSTAADIEYLQMPVYEGQNLPFSAAVRVDNMLYLSGIIGLAPGELKPVPGGVQAEAKRALEIMQEQLETFGSSMNRVVKCTVFLADETDRDAFNAVYVRYFDRKPARSGVTVSGLALGARLELECIAAMN
jgi:reactive intermediate/imine deaminase